MRSHPESPTSVQASRVRLDKWMWAARFFKTRALSSEEIDKGRVRINGLRAKPGRELRLGDQIEWRSGHVERTVIVKAVSDVRGPARIACTLYEETLESVARRVAAAELQRLAPEPALSLDQGRPTKRNRRSMQDLRDKSGPGPAWNDRWSASLDER